MENLYLSLRHPALFFLELFMVYEAGGIFFAAGRHLAKRRIVGLLKPDNQALNASGRSRRS